MGARLKAGEWASDFLPDRPQHSIRQVQIQRDVVQHQAVTPPTVQMVEYGLVLLWRRPGKQAHNGFEVGHARKIKQFADNGVVTRDLCVFKPIGSTPSRDDQV
jgi:hypothetical protein